MAGNLEELQGMLAFGWELYHCDSGNRTTLHYACQGGEREIVDIPMQKFPEMLSHPNEHGLTPFDIAVIYARGTNNSLELLLTKYFDESKKLLQTHFNKGENTPLHLAAHHGRERGVELLLTLGGTNVNPNLKNKFGATPLKLAQEKKSARCVELLQPVTFEE